jgi:general secretion pathway protein K
MDRPDRSAGYITLSVLLISTLAATVAVGLLLTPRPTLGRSLIGLQMVEVEALLDSGLDLAAYRLFAQDGAAEPWRLTPEPVALENGRVVFHVRSEAGRVDINAASPDLLAGLFDAVGARSMPAASFADRVAALRAPDGAEGEGAGRLTAVSDILAVEGLTDADFALIAPHLTVFGGTGLVDPWSAGPVVLKAVPSMGMGDVERILALRQRPNAAARAAMEAIVAEHPDHLASEMQQRFRVTVDAWAANGLTGRAEAIIEDGTEDDPFTILVWSRAPAVRTGKGAR